MSIFNNSALHMQFEDENSLKLQSANLPFSIVLPAFYW